MFPEDDLGTARNSEKKDIVKVLPAARVVVDLLPKFVDLLHSNVSIVTDTGPPYPRPNA